MIVRKLVLTQFFSCQLFLRKSVSVFCGLEYLVDFLITLTFAKIIFCVLDNLGKREKKETSAVLVLD